MSTRKKPSRPPWFNPAHDVVLHAWAESASGPGWSNRPIWVLVRDRRDGSHRVAGLQPEEWCRNEGAPIITLYPVSQHCHSEMTSAVKALVGDKHS